MPLFTRRTPATPVAPPPPAATLQALSQRSLLRPLGIVGYDAIEPALLAALATEEPLLLVSDHGAAMTLLLVRLGEALSLELRHYTASDGTATFYFAPGARARVTFDGRSIQPNHCVLGWYSERPFAKDFNPTARPSRKASRFARDFEELLALLRADMRALVDGSAYTGGGWV